MRYIKLYEAFKSDVLKNTLKFLTNKVNKNTANDFIDEIRTLLNNVNIPISEIDESDIEYLRTSKAFKIKNTEKVDNNYGLYCIKYWFSLKDGLLGKTGVGNEVISFEKVTNKFNDEQFAIIKNINQTGILTPVEDYSELRTGDSIVGVFDSNSESRHSVSFGRIFIERSSIYAFQNASSGSEPESNPSWAGDWEYSWSLGSSAHVSQDHHKLYKYTADDKPLRYSTDEIELEENVFDYNLPMSNMSLRGWRKNENKKIEDSDFAIVFYFDKLLSKESVAIKQKERKDSREDALALMSNEYVKKMNINRFITSLFKKYGITKEKQEFSKLNSMIGNLMSGDFILFDIYSEHSTSRIINFINKIIKLAIVDENTKDVVLLNLISDYKSGKYRYEKNLKEFRSNFELIEKSDKKDLIKIFDDLLVTSKKINNFINNYKIENIDDALLLYYKIKSIEVFISDRSLNSEINRILNNFTDSDRVSRLVNSYEIVSDSELNKEIILLGKYVDSVLK